MNAQQLAQALAQTSLENKKFLSEIDAQIKEADLSYAQILIAEEKEYLEAAKEKIRKAH